MRKAYLAKAIEATEGIGTAYDTNVKFLLADRQILAYIIKYSVTEFTNSNYDDLKKSISIWLCMNSTKKGDSIEEIYLDKKTIFGNPPKDECPDLIRGIIIRLRDRKNIAESKNKLIAMLEVLLSKQSAEEKKNIVSQKYGLIISTDLERRINTMCNLSELILEDALKEGLEKGLKQGEKRKELEIVNNLLKNHLSYDIISDYTGLTIDEIKKIEKESRV